MSALQPGTISDAYVDSSSGACASDPNGCATTDVVERLSVDSLAHSLRYDPLQSSAADNTESQHAS